LCAALLIGHCLWSQLAQVSLRSVVCCCVCSAATLEDIENTRAAFTDDTARLKDELAVQSTEMNHLKTQESELQSCQREKEEDLCAMTRSHEQEREGNQQALEQVRILPLPVSRRKR
jgi:septal ring factor EnvC (AmiA/AmiB activator)